MRRPSAFLSPDLHQQRQPRRIPRNVDLTVRNPSPFADVMDVGFAALQKLPVDQVLHAASKGIGMRDVREEQRTLGSQGTEQRADQELALAIAEVIAESADENDVEHAAVRGR